VVCFPCRPIAAATLQHAAAHRSTTRPHLPVDKVGSDNKDNEVDGTESTGLDGTQTCGDLFLITSTSTEGAKLGCATRSSTHAAIEMCSGNNAGSRPLAGQQNLSAEITSPSRCKQ